MIEEHKITIMYRQYRCQRNVKQKPRVTYMRANEPNLVRFVRQEESTEAKDAGGRYLCKVGSKLTAIMNI